MAVADLHEVEFAGETLRVLTKSPGIQNASTDGPNDPSPGPSHAFQKAATVDTIGTVIVSNDSRQASLPTCELICPSQCMTLHADFYSRAGRRAAEAFATGLGMRERTETRGKWSSNRQLVGSSSSSKIPRRDCMGWNTGRLLV